MCVGRDLYIRLCESKVYHYAFMKTEFKCFWVNFTHQVRSYSFSVFFLHTNFRVVLTSPKSIQATVTLLENLHVILEKTPREDVRSEILPLLFNSFESNTIQVQVREKFCVLYTQLLIKVVSNLTWVVRKCKRFHFIMMLNVFHLRWKPN